MKSLATVRGIFRYRTSNKCSSSLHRNVLFQFFTKQTIADEIVHFPLPKQALKQSTIKEYNEFRSLNWSHFKIHVSPIRRTQLLSGQLDESAIGRFTARLTTTIARVARSESRIFAICALLDVRMNNTQRLDIVINGTLSTD